MNTKELANARYETKIRNRISLAQLRNNVIERDEPQVEDNRANCEITRNVIDNNRGTR